MVWTHSAYPSLKSQGQQLTRDGEKESYKHLSLLFRGYKQYQLKGEVSSLKCSLFTAEWAFGPLSKFAIKRLN